MARPLLFTGIDIGTSQVRVVVAQRDGEANQITILGVGTSPMGGMQRGVITDIDEAVKAVSSALDVAERVAGNPVERAFVAMNGSHISSQNSRGVIAVSRADGEITPEDVERVINAAQAISMPANREILHVLPQNFVVDGQENIQDPIGMTGVRLEVETHVIEGAAPFIKNLTKVINQSGVHIEDFVFAPLAAAQAVLEKRQKELGVVLMDFGAGTTSLAIYEEKALLHTAVLPMGSAHITNDIAIGLRTSIEIAEEIKVKHGTALVGEVKANDTIVIEDPHAEGDDRHQSVSRKEVAEIISARLEELFTFVDKELKKVGRSGLLPAGVVITGGGAHMPGLVDIAKQRLRLPARIGRPQQVGGIMDQAHDPRFAVVLGLVEWAAMQESGQGRGVIRMPNVGKTISNVRGWFRTFLP